MIVDTVKTTIKKYGLLKKGDKVVVGVSGGPDSLTLLYILNALKKELNLKLYVAHFNHMLRIDSALDAEFVKSISSKLGLPFSCAAVNIKNQAGRGSIEEIARNFRLKFLFKVAKDNNSKIVALGHHLDDQAETVLMRILRGTGLYGLSGILPKRNISGFQIIRPLIEVRKIDIERYLKRKKIKPRLDSSNLEDVYFRNRIRNKLLPLLEKNYNKNIRNVLVNLAQSAGADYDFLESISAKKFRSSKTKFALKKLEKLHPALQRLMFRRAIGLLKGDTRRITFQHIREIEDLLLNRPQNSIVNLPQGVAVIKKKTLKFYRKKTQ